MPMLIRALAVLLLMYAVALLFKPIGILFGLNLASVNPPGPMSRVVTLVAATHHYVLPALYAAVAVLLLAGMYWVRLWLWALLLIEALAVALQVYIMAENDMLSGIAMPAWVAGALYMLVPVTLCVAVMIAARSRQPMS